MVLAWVLVQLMVHVGPLVDMEEVLQSLCLAMLEDAEDGYDYHNGFVEAVDLEATAAEEVHMHPSVSRPRGVG